MQSGCLQLPERFPGSENRGFCKCLKEEKEQGYKNGKFRNCAEYDSSSAKISI